MGAWSSANRAFRRRMEPFRVNALAFRPLRVGRTQSNMSTPAATAMTMSRSYPTPIRYRGLDSGRRGAVNSTTLRMASVPSPTATPPMAKPGRSWEQTPSTERRRRSRSVAPCTMPKSAWSWGRAWARTQRSSQRRVRSWASSSRRAWSSMRRVRARRRSSAPSSGRAAGAQSSNAMMMSAPIWFWTRMLDSGPRCTLEPSMKLRNVTPSSPSTAVSLMLYAW